MKVIFRAIVVAWIMAVLTAIPALGLYSVDDDMKGIQVFIVLNLA